VLLLRHSGLRIGDAVTLERWHVTGDELFLYAAKTGTPVYCPLPGFVVTAPDAVPKTSEGYFFWTGESKIESATGDWQRTLKAVFELAGVPRRPRAPLPGHVRGWVASGERANSQCCSGTAASRSRSDITRRGYGRGRSSWRPTFGAAGRTEQALTVSATAEHLR
jgi:hypothetical protein